MKGSGSKLAAVLVLLGGCLAVGGARVQAEDNAKLIERGTALYKEQKCSMCHSIGDQGNKKGPLDGVGKKLSAEDIRLWIIDPKVMTERTKATRKPLMPAYTKLPKEDVEALVAYMQSLK